MAASAGTGSAPSTEARRATGSGDGAAATARPLLPGGATTTVSGTSPGVSAGRGDDAASSVVPTADASGLCVAMPATEDECDGGAACVVRPEVGGGLDVGAPGLTAGAIEPVAGGVGPGVGAPVPEPEVLPGVGAAVVDAARLHAASHALTPGLGFWAASAQFAAASTAWKRTRIASCVSAESSAAEYVTPAAPFVSTHVLLPPQTSGTTAAPWYPAWSA